MSLFQSIARLDDLRIVEVIGAREDWDPSCPEWRSYVSGLGCLRSALRLSSTTITRLSLALPLAALVGVLDGTPLSSCSDWGEGYTGALSLPSLEDLTLELRKATKLDSMQDTIKQLFEITIPHFISRHATLRILAINVQPAGNCLAPCLLLSPLFDALSPEPRTTILPRLQSFSITNPVISFGMANDAVAKELSALARFLRQLADQLTSLRLDLQAHRYTFFSFYLNTQSYHFTLPPPGEWFLNELYSVPFSFLQTLDLSLLFYQSSNYDNAVSIALGRYLNPLLARGLRVLRLRDYVFMSLKEIKILLTAFTSEGRNLVEFHITVQYLTPWLLDLLADRLPALETLGLTFEAFSHEEVTSDELQRGFRDRETPLKVSKSSSDV